MRIQTEDDEAAIAALAERFGIEATISEGAVTFFVPSGEEFVPRLFAELGVAITSVSVSRPTLDDVFMSYTGTTIRDAEESGDEHAQPGHDADDVRGPAMSATERPSPRRRRRAEVIRVRVPPRSWRSELRAMKIVWRRELIRFRSDRMRIVTVAVQPLLFLFVLGSGLQQLSRGEHPRGRPEDLHLPGHPLHRGDVHGDVLGGLDRLGPRVRLPARDDGRAGPAQLDRDRQVPRRRDRRELQGVILLCARRAGARALRPLLILGIFALQLLLAFTITAFGVMVAVRIKQMQTFMGVMQMIVMPMFFISGALFPVAGLPGWLAVLNRLDPLTYAVDPMRRLVFNHLDISDAARARARPRRHLVGLARARRCSRSRSCSCSGSSMLGDRDLGVQRDRVAPVSSR